jgi:hypothetical protein
VDAVRDAILWDAAGQRNNAGYIRRLSRGRDIPENDLVHLLRPDTRTLQYGLRC